MVVLKRILLIANPASRRGSALIGRACAAFARAGVECTVVLTTASGNARDVAREQGARFDAVFTLGGDGTAMEVADALAFGTLALGVLPAGTGNLLAGALGIPRDVGKAVARLLAGHVRQIDLGVVQGTRFAVAAGVGIDSTMVAETPRWLKRRLGVFAYAIVATRAAVRAVLFRRFFLARVTIGDEVIERRVAGVMFANFGSILDERLTFGPDIEVDDGLLDCCVIAPRGVGDAIRIMWRITRADFRDDPALVYRKGASFFLETFPPQRLQADGELLGLTPATIGVLPLAARMIVPGR